MPDYDFRGLSWRSFEQLIQALCYKELTEQIGVFGDGPDGGREATFAGSTRYGTPNWNGQGVVQVKFRQRPEGTSQDGEWFFSQLERELNAMTQRKLVAELDYYIIVTNVVLSPAADGAKDRSMQALDAFRSNQSLSGVDIWDFDKLRVMLDNTSDVRKAYAAWITSGDVLAELRDWINGLTPDLETTVVNFLQKELLSDQYARLEQAGYSADERISLANVFVDLPVAPEPTSEPIDEEEGRQQIGGFVDVMLQEARDRLVPGPDGVPSGVHPEGESRGGRFVLVGGPGQGKTTLGQYLCQLFRASILQDLPTSRLSAETHQAINGIVEQAEREHLDLPRVRRLPIRIVLSEFATRLESGEARSFLGFIAGHISKRTDVEVDVDALRRFLAGYPCLIVLDGLDEVPASTNRQAVLQAVTDFWVDVAAADIDALVVATTRPQGYANEFSPGRYEHQFLVPLSVERSLAYGSRFTRSPMTQALDYV